MAKKADLRAPKMNFIVAFSDNPINALPPSTRAGADLEANNQAGMTPLHLAASSKVEERLSFVKSLINSGADIAATDRIGRTPLYLAAASGHSEVCALLVACSPPLADVISLACVS